MESRLYVLFYLLLYAFLGWAIEVLVYTLRDRQFVNRGFLNVPFALPYGITAAILFQALPTLEGNAVLQLALCAVVHWAVTSVTDWFVRRLRQEERRREPEPTRRQLLLSLLGLCIVAAVYLTLYQVVQPLVYLACRLLPQLLIRVLVITSVVVIAIDFGCVLYALRTRVTLPSAQSAQRFTRRLANGMRRRICRRLERNYPGILEEGQERAAGYVFAQGLCADKLVWVFLTSSFLGALIEMTFCRVTAGTWMNRSSVLYGAFSFVWGFGAVLLTVTLQRLAQKADRHVFLAGFVIGGVYEYLCSVFTELVFGTVFWDYSEMPLNIGGRTNVLYCIFWGLLAVVWVKILYPIMSGWIERIPALLGKILTWIVLALMLCNGLLTAAAMTRYTQRQTDPTADTVIEQFLDSRYDDDYMEQRWPNMVLAEP